MKTYSVCIQSVLRVAIGLLVVAWVANAAQAQAQMGAHAVSDPYRRGIICPRQFGNHNRVTLTLERDFILALGR